MIRLREVTVVYGHTVALEAVDLDVPPGITGLFGQNGSGKSTLLRVVAGLVAPSAGTVSVDGARLEPADESFRRRVGYAGHAGGFYPRLSLMDNLLVFAGLYGAPRRRAADLLEALGLHAYAGVDVVALSAGLARRAAVARALLHDPDILLLDEPYANVDDEAAADLSAAVRSWASAGKLAVIATHGAKKVKPFADRGIVLGHGRTIVETDYEERRGALRR